MNNGLMKNNTNNEVMKIEDVFSKLLGRAATDEERIQLYRTRDAIGLNNNDALWLVLMTLQSYQTQYEGIPRLIAAETVLILENTRRSATAVAKEAISEVHKNLSEAVVTTATEVADKVAGKDRAKWISGAVVVSLVSMITVAYVAQSFGFDSGKAAGYEESKNQVAAANWANTTEGQAAYKLSQKTSLAELTHCKGGPNWYVKNGICYPEPEFMTDKEGKKTGAYNISGWYVVSPEAGKKNVAVLKEKSVIPAAEEKKGFFSFIGF